MSRRLTGRVGLALLVGTGCDRPGGPVAVSVQLDRTAPDFGLVRIDGLTAGARRRALADGLEAVTVRAIAVRAGAGQAESEDGGLVRALPPLAGRWRQAGGGLEFRPRFPPTAGLRLVVSVDTARLSGGGGTAAGASLPASPPLVRRFDVPAADDQAQPPAVTAIYPTGDTLPENLLRIYLEFSTPMRPGEALSHVRLLDQRGQEVRAAFLDLSQELWDPEGRRLTLLFDPGRVKRGIRTNLEMGRPLRAGHRYTLRVEPGWRDLRGAPTVATVERRIVAAPADFDGPDPSRWTIVAPRRGSTDPLEVRLGDALDRPLALRLIVVRHEAGSPVGGRASLGSSDRVWRFVPTEPWRAGAYRLTVSPELEDLAGNRPGRPFDRELASGAASVDRSTEIEASSEESGAGVEPLFVTFLVVN